MQDKIQPMLLQVHQYCSLFDWLLDGYDGTLSLVAVSVVEVHSCRQLVLENSAVMTQSAGPMGYGLGGSSNGNDGQTLRTTEAAGSFASSRRTFVSL